MLVGNPPYLPGVSPIALSPELAAVRRLPQKLWRPNGVYLHGAVPVHFVGSDRCASGVAWRRSRGRAADDAPRFNRDIRPILADKCYACHGPDSGTREAELRLDTEEGSHESAITAGRCRFERGDFAASRATTRTMRMPPAASKKPPLTPEQVELLEKWINAGAKYEPHWAYIRADSDRQCRQ